MTKVSPQLLKSFKPFSDLETEQLMPLLKGARLKQANAGRCLMELGSASDKVIYLVGGKLQLVAKDGAKHTVESGSDKAKAPIAQLLPRQYRVETVTPVDYLQIERKLVETLIERVRAEEIERTREMKDYPLETKLYMELERDIENDTLVLPSLPEVAVRIREVVQRENSDAESLAKILRSDPAITAKLIKVANGPLYAGGAPVRDCTGAVVRLGRSVVHDLILSFVIKEVFNSPYEILQKRMLTLWQHSVEISTTSFLLAKLSGKKFDPEKALVVGLMHDIGIIPILTYAGHYPEIVRNEAMLEQVINRLRGQIGAVILRNWNFPDDFIPAALEAEDWDRNPGDEADYCDLVLVAHIYGQKDNPAAASGIPMHELPALQRLGLEIETDVQEFLELRNSVSAFPF
jgi:HD-like signal output (HDOD) protein